MKDVEISESAPKTLLLQKHADYIAAYGEKKDDYVCIMPTVCTVNIGSHLCTMQSRFIDLPV